MFSVENEDKKDNSFSPKKMVESSAGRTREGSLNSTNISPKKKKEKDDYVTQESFV